MRPGPGEVQVEGTVQQALAPEGHLVVLVSRVTTPDGIRADLNPHRSKRVLVGKNTLLRRSDNPAQQVTLAELRAGSLVTAVGKNLGPGREVPARAVFVAGADLAAAKNLLKPTADPRNWTLMQKGGAKASLSAEANALRVTVTAVDEVVWNAQVMQKNIDLEEGVVYTLRFRARADAPRELGVRAQIEQADYHAIGLHRKAHLGAEWRSYAYTFTTKNMLPRYNACVFHVGDKPGTLWLADVSLQKDVSERVEPVTTSRTRNSR
jgi:hypothetical protein